MSMEPAVMPTAISAEMIPAAILAVTQNLTPDVTPDVTQAVKLVVTLAVKTVAVLTRHL